VVPPRADTARRRRRAAELFAAGRTRAQVARELGVSRAATTRWYRLWAQGGVGALVRRALRGRPPKLDARDLEAVQRALARPPRESGFELERWSLNAAALLIARATGVTYHPRHVARVLRRAGWVVAPVGACAAAAFRQRPSLDPDGNVLLLRERWPAGEPG
jgi:transposase